MLLPTLIGLIGVSFILSLFLAFKTTRMHNELILSLRENSIKLKQRSQDLKNLQKKLKEKPEELSKMEMEHVRDEIQKVSHLWKSRREKLRSGLWKKMGKGHEEKEKIEKEKAEQKEEKKEDKLSRLKTRREQIKNLMKKTKIEYRKRKIDEVSFREIMRDYQKELMEIEMKISDLEPQS